MKTNTWRRHCRLGAALLAAGTLTLGLRSAALAQDAPQPGSAARPPVAAGPFILMAQLHVKADREKDFLKLLAQMTHRAKTQDHGNIRYELFAVAPPANAGAGAAGANYVFLEEWRDQAAATAHGKWAGPIVRTQWREMTDSMQLMRLSRVPAH